jgi:Stress responsive A/B Barrel Domain
MSKNTLKESSRRQFMSNVGKATLAASAMPLSVAKKIEKKGMFIHHVYFWLKKTGSKEDTAKLIEGLRKLSKVKTIQQFSIGIPAMTPRDVVDNSYAISWLCFFKNGKEQASYQIDPIHLKFVEDYSHLWERVIVYDTVDA